MGPIVISIDPIIVQVGHFTLRWYGLFIAMAIVVGFSIALREGRRKGASEDDVYGVGMWGVLGGLVGARLFHVVDRWPYYIAHPTAAFAIQDGGLAIYGGIIGGVVAGAIYARHRRISIPLMLDVTAPALLIGQAIGRIGCLINGDSLGPATNLPWGFVYVNPAALAPSLGVAYQPVPAYEMLGDLLILALIWKLRTRLKVNGALFLLYLTLYSILKFADTFLRHELLFLGGFQEAQVLSMAGGLAAVAALIWLARSGSLTVSRLPVATSAKRTSSSRPNSGQSSRQHQ